MAINVDSEELQKFRSILSDLLSADNESRATAEASYAEIPSAQKIFFLLPAMRNFEPEQGQLAAVLLRRLFSSEFEAFSKLPPEAQMQVKNELLDKIRGNVEPNFRRKLSDVVSELARNCIDDEGNNNWAEVLKFLFEAASSQDPGLREIALLLFGSVPGIFGKQLSRYISVVHQMLAQSLADKRCIDVQYAAAKALSSFLLAHEKEPDVQKNFNGCLSLLLELLTQVMENSDERADDILRHFVDLVETCFQTFRQHVDFLFQVCLKIIATSTCHESCRHLALEVLITLAESAPGMVKKVQNTHIPVLISALFTMMTDIPEDPLWEKDEDCDDEESDSNNIIGEAALDRLACALGGKTVLPIVLTSLPLMLNSADWKNRYAGLMTISAVGEGCHKQMANILHQMVSGVLPFLGDANTRVRYAACNALGQMASDFAPSFQKKFADKVIEGLLNVVSDSSCSRVQAHAGAALVNFFEDCPKNVLLPYLDRICNCLESVLQMKLNELVENGTKLVLEQIVVTLASLADCSEDKFLTYYDKFIPYLKFIIQNALQPELRILRGKTIECISLIGLAVGQEKFLPDASAVMDLLLKSQTASDFMDEDDPQLTYMIAAWARICRVMGKGFAPYLPFVMQPVLKAAAIKPEIAVLDVDDMKVIENDDDWEFVNLGDKHNFGIRTVGLDEKATACQMLVCYARELKDEFAPYAEETLKLMLPQLKFYFHEGVRAAAADILPHLLESVKMRGDAYVLEMWKFILPQLFQAIDSEPEAEVLSDELNALKDCLDCLNCMCLTHDDIITLINILEKKFTDHFEKYKAREDKRHELSNDDALEELLSKEDDADIYILSRISDLMGTLFSIYKEAFYPYFDMLLPHYIKLMENDGTCDCQLALGVFADLIKHVGPACARYQEHFLSVLINGLEDSFGDLRQTAAYAAGLLGQYGGPQFTDVCRECLPLLIKMINDPCSRNEENIKATENAISAITKFFMYNNTFINMDDILPSWISWLPIWEDGEEAKFVYGFLCSLLETNHPALLGLNHCNVPRIVQIMCEAISRNGIEITSDVGERTCALLQNLQNDGPLFAACVNNLTPPQRDALRRAMTK